MSKRKSRRRESNLDLRLKQTLDPQTSSRLSSAPKKTYVVSEYGALSGSRARQMKGIPCDNPSASNVLSLTLALCACMALRNWVAARRVCSFIRASMLSSANMFAIVRSVCENEDGRLVNKFCGTGSSRVGVWEI